MKIRMSLLPKADLDNDPDDDNEHQHEHGADGIFSFPILNEQ